VRYARRSGGAGDEQRRRRGNRWCYWVMSPSSNRLSDRPGDGHLIRRPPREPPGSPQTAPNQHRHRVCPSLAPARRLGARSDPAPGHREPPRNTSLPPRPCEPAFSGAPATTAPLRPLITTRGPVAALLIKSRPTFPSRATPPAPVPGRDLTQKRSRAGMAPRFRRQRIRILLRRKGPTRNYTQSRNGVMFVELRGP
jgi:hypothetical protein